MDGWMDGGMDGWMDGRRERPREGRRDGAEPPIDNWDAYEKLCYSEDEPVVNIQVETRVQTSLAAPGGAPTAV